jgi:hypothetical protein
MISDEKLERYLKRFQTTGTTPELDKRILSRALRLRVKYKSRLRPSHFLRMELIVIATMVGLILSQSEAIMLLQLLFPISFIIIPGLFFTLWVISLLPGFRGSRIPLFGFQGLSGLLILIPLSIGLVGEINLRLFGKKLTVSMDQIRLEDEITQNVLTQVRARPLSEQLVSVTAPPFDATLTEERISRKYRFYYTINNSQTVILLDIVPLDKIASTKFLKGRLFPSYRAALAAIEPRLKGYGMKSYRWYYETKFWSGDITSASIDFLPSIELIHAKLKVFNDGLFARLEEVLERGLLKFSKGKRDFLMRLYGSLLNRRARVHGFSRQTLDQAIVYIAVGLMAGGMTDLNISEDLLARVQTKLLEFLNDPVRSKPIGFYDWTDQLRNIYKQDMFFQTPLTLDSHLETGAALWIASAIDSDPGLSADYKTILAFYEKLTNPPKSDRIPWTKYLQIARALGGVESVLSSSENAKVFARRLQRFIPAGKPLDEVGFALIPWATSKETVLFERFQISRDFMQFLIEKIRSGELDLSPRPGSGWYEYQIYALETLLVPEKAREYAKVRLTPEYKKRLEAAFKTIMTQVRETHVKTLPIIKKKGISALPREITITPELCCEPLPTVYLRHARAYRFLRDALDELFGLSILKGLRRLNEDGSDPHRNLAGELEKIGSILYGCHLLSLKDIGQRPQLADGELSRAHSYYIQKAARWLKGLLSDKDLSRDTRVSVPIHVDQGTGKVTLWCTAGVEFVLVKASFLKPPRVEVPDPGVKIKFAPHYYLMPVDVFLEVRRPVREGVLTRTQFRRLCDRYKSKQDILRALLLK